MATSKVISAVYLRGYDSTHGTMYVHKIAFENGDEGEYTSKKQQQDTFVVGKEAVYELSETTVERGGRTFVDKKIKPVKPHMQGLGGGFTPEDEERIKKSVFLSFCDNHEMTSKTIGLPNPPSKNDIWKALQGLYASLANDRGTRISFHGVVNHIAEMYFRYGKEYPVYTVEDITKKIIANFNLVNGIK